MDNARLKKYAELLVRSGGNVQPGQFVVISCAVDTAYFGRLVQEAAYDAGASEVRMDWHDEKSVRETFLRGANEIFDTFPQWRVDKFKEQDDRKAVYLHISSSDPDNLKGVDPDRLRRTSMVASKATKAHSELTMSNALRWSVVAIPSAKWATKVFPGVSEEEAIDKLWAALLKGARADGEDLRGDWETHRKNFVSRVKYLNDQQFAKLRVTTGLGTDLTVGLVKNHVWTGGGDVGQDGIPFFPNIPTEEIFTMPHKDIADGRVIASMPLSYQGNLIEGFEMTFKDGKVVDYKAEKNQEVLKNMLEMDEGSGKLGEFAIVANSSPIGQMGILFYNTLFDENASAHLAIGKAYPSNMAGGEKMSAEERKEKGGNDSLIHVDFMFGTSDMKIVGIREDGSEEVFFDNGEYIK